MKDNVKFLREIRKIFYWNIIYRISFLQFPKVYYFYADYIWKVESKISVDASERRIYESMEIEITLRQKFPEKNISVIRKYVKEISGMFNAIIDICLRRPFWLRLKVSEKTQTFASTHGILNGFHFSATYKFIYLK